MILKRKAFFLIIIAWLVFLPRAEPARLDFSLSSLSQPSQTELQDKETMDMEGAVLINRYKYRSELSSSEIASFYRGLFADLGFRQQTENSENNQRLHFSRGFIQQAEVQIFEPTPFIEDSRRLYYVVTYDLYDILLLSRLSFGRPRRDQLPVPPDSTEGVEMIQGSPAAVPYTTYLTKGEAERVINFYLENMPRRGWELKDDFHYQGRGNLFNALLHIPERRKIYTDYGIDPETFFPGIEVEAKGATLKYEKQGQVSVITIIQFLDSPEYLRRMRINPEFFEQYGNIFIQAALLNKREDEDFYRKGRSYMSEDGDFLRRFLGY